MHRLLWLVGGMVLCGWQGCHWVFPYGARPSETGIPESSVTDQLTPDGAVPDQPGLEGPLGEGPLGTPCGPYSFGFDTPDLARWDKVGEWHVVVDQNGGYVTCGSDETDASITTSIPLDCAAGKVTMTAQLKHVSAPDACAGANLTLLDDQKTPVLSFGMDYCHGTGSVSLWIGKDRATADRVPTNDEKSHVLTLEFTDSVYRLAFDNTTELTAIRPALLTASLLRLGGWQTVSENVLYYDVAIDALTSPTDR